jgi:hypothetical protein
MEVLKFCDAEKCTKIAHFRMFLGLRFPFLIILVTLNSYLHCSDYNNSILTPFVPCCQTVKLPCDVFFLWPLKVSRFVCYLLLQNTQMAALTWRSISHNCCPRFEQRNLSFPENLISQKTPVMSWSFQLNYGHPFKGAT